MFIDIHTHLLPALDDGAIADFDCYAQLEGMIRRGAAGIFCTPHSWALQNQLRPEDRAGRERAEQLFLEKQAVCPVPLYLGCELYWNEEPEKHQALLQGLQTGILPTMNQTDYVLVEFDTAVKPETVREAFRQLKSSGYQMILAHGERFPHLMERDFLGKLKEKGALIQISSVPDTPAQTAAQKFLMAERLADFLGSDNHGSLVRASFVEEALFAGLAEDYREDLLWKNAVRYLNCAPSPENDDDIQP